MANKAGIGARRYPSGGVGSTAASSLTGGGVRRVTHDALARSKPALCQNEPKIVKGRSFGRSPRPEVGGMELASHPRVPRRGAAALALLLSMPLVPSAAQQTVRNPHGPLDEECAVCHTSAAWTPARISAQFKHARHGFALTGAHATASCLGCHAKLDFRGVPRDCASCHADVHHGELGTDCGRCHTARSFIDRSIMLRAHQVTRFPLSGAHLALDCESCHTPAPQGQSAFRTVSSECVACHLAQFQAAKSPDHVASGFPEDCNACHLATTWSAARFNHDATGFPLTGAHRALPCERCHGSTGFSGQSAACVSCHQQDYDGTTNPNHAASGFPTQCDACHSTSSWAGATLNHVWFPLPHAQAQCADCHTIASDYSVFVCTNCHTQATTDRRHGDVRGYVWDSAHCYACHRNGGGGG
jgi:hypothetical protein